jgi:hypothetical protein
MLRGTLLSVGSDRTEKPLLLLPRLAASAAAVPSSTSSGWRRIHGSGSAGTAALHAEHTARIRGRHLGATRPAMQRTMSPGRSAMLPLAAISAVSRRDCTVLARWIVSIALRVHRCCFSSMHRSLCPDPTGLLQRLWGLGHTDTSSCRNRNSSLLGCGKSTLCH